MNDEVTGLYRFRDILYSEDGFFKYGNQWRKRKRVWRVQ